MLDRPSVAPEAETSPDSLVAQLDPKVFTASLWNPKPPVPAPQAETPSPAKPSKPDISLVAIIERSERSKGEGRLQAALYDPTEQRIRVLDPGATIRQFTVLDVTSAGVILIEGQWRHELRLREDAPEHRLPLTSLIDELLPQARAKP